MTTPEKLTQISELLIDKLASEEPEWIVDAACADSDIDPFDPESVEEMKALCKTCPVFEECGEYSQQKNVTNGVWAGILAVPAVPKKGGNKQ